MFRYILYSASILVLSFITYLNLGGDAESLGMSLTSFTIISVVLVILGSLLKLSVKTESQNGPISGIMRFATIFFATMLQMLGVYLFGFGCAVTIGNGIAAGTITGLEFLFLAQDWYWLTAIVLFVSALLAHYWELKEGAFLFWRFRNETEEQAKASLERDFRRFG